MMGFTNIARWDRLLRLLLGIGMLYFGWFQVPAGLLQAALRIFGWIPLATGVLGWSPLYSFLGLDTRRLGGPREPTE